MKEKEHKPGIQNLQHNDGMQVYAGTRGKKINDLRALADIVPKTGLEVALDNLTWEDAQAHMKSGGCTQSHLWTNGEFMWLTPDKYKHVASTESLYEPVTKEVLQRLGYKKLLIRKHMNKMRGGAIDVGYRPTKEEQQALWRVYVP